MSSIELDLNGYTDVPDTKIAVVVTYLEMLSRPDLTDRRAPDGVTLERWHNPDPEQYVRLFRAIGDEWLWFGRLVLDRAELGKILRQPSREIFVPVRDGKQLGLLEIDYSDPENPELAYFGLVPEAIGGGMGGWLMKAAMDMVWSRSETRRFWVHTCTGDSPQALGFYMAVGFTPYKRAIEIADDPRLLGVLEDHLGPHLPKLA